MREGLTRDELKSVTIWRLVANIAESIEESMKVKTTPKQWYQIYDFISDFCDEFSEQK